MAFVTTKGWKSPADIVKSYRGAETLIGRDPGSVLPIPKAGDTAAWEQTWSKLGRPESADKYDLKAGLPAGANVDEGFTKAIGGLFHKAGLTAEQAKAVAAGYNELASGKQTQAETDRAANVTADKAALQTKWGGGYERQLATAKMAVAELGFSADEVNALEDVIGYGATMEKFAALGKRLSDPNFVTGGDKPRFDGTLTPAEAGEEIRKMKMDKGFQASLFDVRHPAYKENKARWDNYHKIAYPG